MRAGKERQSVDTSWVVTGEREASETAAAGLELSLLRAERRVSGLRPLQAIDPAPLGRGVDRPWRARIEAQPGESRPRQALAQGRPGGTAVGAREGAGVGAHQEPVGDERVGEGPDEDRKSTRLNSSD